MSKIILILFLLSSTIQILQAKELQISHYLLLNPSKEILEMVSLHNEIVAKNGNDYEIYVGENNLNQFLKIVPSAKLLALDIHQELLKQLSENSLASTYRTYEEAELFLHDLEKKYPNIVKLEIYGKSAEGRNLYALKISDQVEIDENEPELLITAATHGDEVIGVKVVLTLIEQMLEGYVQNDSRFKEMINNHEIYFIPMLNADGFAKRRRYDGYVDPNRDFPGPDKPDRVTTAKSIIEIRKFFDQHPFVASLDFHAFGEMVMYPWAHTLDSLQDKNQEAFFDDLVFRMSELNHYKAGQISQVIYVAKGSSVDYFYWTKKTKALAVEIAGSKAPWASQIPGIIEDSREMTWRFIESF